MPKIHPVTGLAACGTAGGRVSFGGRTGEQNVLTDGGCTFWLTADEIAYLGPLSGSWAGTPGATAPQAVNIHTGARRPLEAVPEGTARREASFLAASPAGRWQAAQAGQGATFGSCGDFPGGTISRATTDGRGAAAADGTIVLLDSYQGENNGFRLARPDGSISDTIEPGRDFYHLTAIDAQRAIWPDVGRWGTTGIDTSPLWLPGSLRACWCDVAGVVYLVHWLEGVGLVARRADSDQGKVLAREAREFHYDAIAWNGAIRVAWATIDGEPPGSLVIVEWDCRSDVEDLTSAPPIVVIPTFAFNHKVMIAVFKDPAGASRAPVEILVNQNKQVALRPAFVAEDSLIAGHLKGKLLGLYSEAKGADLVNALKKAAAAKTRLLLAHDSQDPWTLQPGLRKWDIPTIELYRYVGETLAQAHDRWRLDAQAMLAAWPGDCGVVPMFYCMGGGKDGNPPEVWPVPDVLDTQRFLSEIVNKSPRIKVVAPFSYLRANGIDAHVEFQQSFKHLLAAAPEMPDLLPVDPPKPPDPIDPVDPTPYPSARPYETRKS